MGGTSILFTEVPPSPTIFSLRSENELECELRDARVARARDGPKGSAAGKGTTGARIVEQGVVEDVKVLGSELQAPLAG
jgi:hypothetical protein